MLTATATDSKTTTTVEKVEVQHTNTVSEEAVKVDVKETKTEVTVHDHGHSHSHGHGHDHHHGHSHDGDESVHPQGQAINYREAPPQFGLATHVDDIIHTEFRYVNGFRPFQFDAPGSCLGPMSSDEPASK
ncbi:hypothetical protein LPJ66_006011 [Kickxella alabastrina]|uniref:Uncharacterized protein n=1 Tax=Kickxella alabastrina TaxID=61397 RepID=A0ACC1IDM5_9FUNG|nr:hypothetical protein LPJ66_006011 [Kickxella alabastrina]